MKKRVKTFIILLVCIGAGLAVQAQEIQPGEKQFEIDMVWGFAQGSFEDNLERPMPGVVISFGGRTPNLPLVLSTEISWMNYGFDNHLELQYPGNNVSPISLINVATKNSMLLTHFAVRVVPFDYVIAPYVDGLFGFKYLSTNISAESEAIIDDDSVINLDDEDRISTSSTYNTFTLSYGFGAGLNLEIFKGRLGFHNPNSTISLQVGAQYLFGSKAEYLTERSIRAELGRIYFERVESRTNMLIPKLGFRIGIN